MKWVLVLVLVTVSWAQSILPLAEPCDRQACQLPDCRCSGTDIPGEFNARDVPQFVVLTFDDEVNVTNINSYLDLIYNRRNTNGCPIGTTFYVNHEHTDYTMVNELYNRGFEIALHSITHRSPSTFWAQASYDYVKMEFGDQRVIMSHFANIPYDAIKGVRLPFLQMIGNVSFQVMADYGLQYDCSWPTINHVDPGLWPYTLDYASTQDCVIDECPTASIPGVWVLPMVSWVDLIGYPCLMADYCMNGPPVNDEDAWFKFIVTNFERHYLGNRAPFGIYIHEVYFAANPVVREAFRRFLNMINKMHDVFMVNSADVIDWVKNPVPLPEYKQQPCKTFIPTTCPANSCGPLTSDHNEGSYLLQICNVCPNVYPWLGNPLGQ